MKVKNIGDNINFNDDNNNLSKEDWLNNIKKNKYRIESIPEKIRTEDICLEAIKHNGHFIKYVPEEERTLEMCILAIENNPYTIKHISKKMKSEDLCLKAVKQNGLTIQYLDEETQTNKVCLEAVKQNGFSIELISNKNINSDLILEAIKNNGNSIKCINFFKQTPKLSLEAIKNKSNIIKYINDKQNKFYLYAFLNDFELSKDLNIKNKVDKIVKKEFKINNVVFYNENYNSKNKKYDLFNKNKYDFINIDIRSFEYLKNYLLIKNNKNHFIFNDNIDISVFKDICFSNNELIVIDTGNIRNIHKKLANRVI